MQVAIRSYLIAGMSAVAVSAIALSPVSAPPDIQIAHITAPAISLAASPIDTYAAVLQAAIANSGELLDAFLADPAPVITKVANNQVAAFGLLAETFGTYAQTSVGVLTTVVPALLQQATAQLLAGNVEGAINSLQSAGLATLSPILALPAPITAVLNQPIQNMLNVINALTSPEAIGIIGLGLIGPGVSTIGATGAAIQNVIDAVSGGDLTEVFNAIATGPATIADGFLNGGYGPNLGALAGLPPVVTVLAGGILSPAPAPGLTFTAPGPIAAFNEIKAIIAGALAPVVEAPAQEAAENAAPEKKAVQLSLAGPADTDTDAVADTDSDAPEVTAPVKSGSKAQESHATADAGSSSSSPKSKKAGNASARKSSTKASSGAGD
jgi:hypothetical protein